MKSISGESGDSFIQPSVTPKETAKEENPTVDADTMLKSVTRQRRGAIDKTPPRLPNRPPPPVPSPATLPSPSFFSKISSGIRNLMGRLGQNRGSHEPRKAVTAGTSLKDRAIRPLKEPERLSQSEGAVKSLEMTYETLKSPRRQIRADRYTKMVDQPFAKYIQARQQIIGSEGDPSKVKALRSARSELQIAIATYQKTVEGETRKGIGIKRDRALEILGQQFDKEMAEEFRLTVIQDFPAIYASPAGWEFTQEQHTESLNQDNFNFYCLADYYKKDSLTDIDRQHLAIIIKDLENGLPRDDPSIHSLKELSKGTQTNKNFLLALMGNHFIKSHEVAFPLNLNKDERLAGLNDLDGVIKSVREKDLQSTMTSTGLEAFRKLSLKERIAIIKDL